MSELFSWFSTQQPLLCFYGIVSSSLTLDGTVGRSLTQVYDLFSGHTKTFSYPNFKKLKPSPIPKNRTRLGTCDQNLERMCWLSRMKLDFP